MSGPPEVLAVVTAVAVEKATARMAALVVPQAARAAGAGEQPVPAGPERVASVECGAFNGEGVIYAD